MTTDDVLSFHKVVSPRWHNRRAPMDSKMGRFSHEPQDIYRNSLGYEIRCVNPWWCVRDGRLGSAAQHVGRHFRSAWRWELHGPNGSLIASEPRFRDCMDEATKAIVFRAAASVKDEPKDGGPHE